MYIKPTENKMIFLPVLSKNQIKSIWRFLKKRTISIYSYNKIKMNIILDTLNRFFQFRMNSFNSKLNVLKVMKTIAKYFCFVSDTADFALCTWSELVLRTFFVVPSIKLLNKKRLYFRYKNTVFVVHPSYYVYGYHQKAREATFNITIV